MEQSTKRPEWAIAAEDAIRNKSKIFVESGILTEKIKKEQLEGMRVFVVKNDKTGEVAPMTIVYGKDFQDYDSFMDAVEKITSDFYLEHGLDKDGLVIEDRWARNIEEFKKDNPELAH